MSEIIIKTFFDFLGNYNDIIRKRYLGSFEFNEFKSYLSKKTFLIIIYIVLILIVSLLIIFLGK